MKKCVERRKQKGSNSGNTCTIKSNFAATLMHFGLWPSGSQQDIHQKQKKKLKTCTQYLRVMSQWTDHTGVFANMAINHFNIYLCEKSPAVKLFLMLSLNPFYKCIKASKYLQSALSFDLRLTRHCPQWMFLFNSEHLFKLIISCMWSSRLVFLIQFSLFSCTGEV